MIRPFQDGMARGRAGQLRLRAFGLCVWVALAGGAYAASPITSTTIINATDASLAQTVASSYSQPCITNPTNPAFPAGVSCPTSGASTPTNLNYTGLTRRLSSVTANATLFVPAQMAPTSVVVNRNNAPASGHDPNRVVLFADLANSSGAAASSISDINNIYLRSPYAKTIEDAFSLSVLNLGIDNVFQNANDLRTNNFNNIESLDFYFSPVVPGASALTRNGYAVIERGGNDAFKISGLRGSGGSCGAVTRLPLVTVAASSWTPAANIYTRTDVVARRDPATDAEMRPDNSLTQTLKGLFFSFADLGFSAGDTVCGYAVYGQDALGTDPSDPAQNPTGTTSNNILDLVASVSLYTADTDMTVALSTLPALLGPGQTVTGQTVTCTNLGLAPATAASCGVTPDVGTVSNLVCTPPPGGTVAVGASIACTYDYTAPGTPGGTDLTTTQVTLTGTTGASNDSNSNNNTAQRSAPLIDALDDPFGLVTPETNPNAGNVLTNDQSGASTNLPVIDVVITVLTPATPLGGGTVPVLNTGTGAVTVPVGTPAGSYSIEYQICSASTQAACDIALVTVSVTAPAGPPPVDPPPVDPPPPPTDADMAVTMSPLPALLGPGQTVTGETLTCTNLGPASATAASCGVTPDVGTVSNLVCTPPTGGTVAVGASIACTYDYTAPGTPGGTDLTTTQVTLTGTTGASNDSNSANNTAQRSAPMLDAVNDPFGPVGPSGTPNAGNVLTNDGSGGTPNVPLANVVITVITPAGPGTVPVLDPSTGVVSVPPNTPPGNYTIGYRICAVAAPTACDNATVTIEVTPQFVPPSLSPDQSLGNPPGTTVTVPVLNNDDGASSPMDPATVRIVGPSGPLTSLTVPGQGVWVVNPDGSITFTPEPGFPGDPTPIQYTASNTNGDPAGPTTVTVTYTRQITGVPIDSPWALALMALAMVGFVAGRARRPQ